jgi:outer membrane receptor protein involved in Fe transport
MLVAALVVAGVGFVTSVSAQESQAPGEAGQAPEEVKQAPAEGEPAPEKVQKLEGVEVIGRAEDLVGVANSATEGTVGQKQLESRPILRTGEIMETVPGVVITQHSGAGKANQYYLRGFNLDHGTDLATDVNGMPVNMPTHGHGQGYTDVNFVIPELITGIQYKKGPYFAEEGDFAAAGAIDMNLATRLPRGIAELTYGSFDYMRALLADSQELGAGTMLYAFEYYHNDGPWDHPDDYKRYNGVLRYTLGTGQNQLSVTAMGYNGEWDATDQVAQRAIDSGLIGRFGTLDPTTGGESHRYSLSTEFERTSGSAATRANAYFIDYGLNLFSNFTYDIDPINGDQFEQVDDRWIAGARASHTWFGPLLGLDMDNTIGFQVRHDNIGEVGLHLTTARQRHQTIREDEVQQTSEALYVQNGTRWAEKFRTVAGLRADFYQYDVESNVPANSGSESASIVSPKLSMIFGPWAKTEFYLNGGYGFHGNDARGTTITVDPVDQVTPVDQVDALVRAKGYEVGARTSALAGLQSTLSVWNLDLDSELLFIGDAGITEPTRPSRRTGVEWTNYYDVTSWMSVDADFAYTKAEFTEDAPEGNHIPGAIEGVVAAGVTIDNLDGPFGSLRVRYFGPRPLIEDDSVRSDASTLVNAQVGYRISNTLRVAIDVFNIFDTEANDVEYYYESQISDPPLNEAALVFDKHIHPAESRSVRASLVYNF